MSLEGVAEWNTAGENKNFEVDQKIKGLYVMCEYDQMEP